MKTSFRKFLLLHVTRACAIVSVLLWGISQFTYTRVAVRTDSAICSVQFQMTPQGLLLMRSNQTGAFSFKPEFYPIPIDNENRYKSGGISFEDGGGVSFFDRWPVNYWFEPKVVPNETLLTRAGFITVRHWLFVLVFTLLYLAVRSRYKVHKPQPTDSSPAVE